ncbi:MAG: histidine kinase, partial [Mycobacteriales bacterium]
TLRLPEQLRQRVDEAAHREGLSVNTWLVRATGAALSPSSASHLADRRGGTQAGRQYTGWVR